MRNCGRGGAKAVAVRQREELARNREHVWVQNFMVNYKSNKLLADCIENNLLW